MDIEVTPPRWYRRKMVQSLLLTGTLALTTACSASDTGEDQDDEINIAFMMPDTVLSRWEEQDRPNFVAAVEAECEECKVTPYNADADPDKQKDQAESAIVAGADVLVITPVDESVAVGIVQQASEQGVSVITYGRTIPSEGVDYAVSADAYDIGVLQAESLLDGMEAEGKSSGDIIAHHGAPTDSLAPEYKAGALSVLEDSDYTLAAQYDTPGWDPSEAQKQMEQAISSVGAENIVGVYAGNDGIASGVIAAMTNGNVDPYTVPVTGQDAETSALQRIIAGEQYSTIYQPIPEFSANAAKLAISLAKGEDAPEGIINGTVTTDAGETDAYLYDTVVVTQDNLEDTVIADGYVTVDELCTDKYVEACEELGLLK